MLSTKTLLSALLLLALQAPPIQALSPDPAGQSKLGNAAHQSTIGSQCLSSLDCGANGNTACCAFLPQAGGETIGICSGCGATTQQGKQGCGFGDQGKNLVSDPQVCPASSSSSSGASGQASGQVAQPQASSSPAPAAAVAPNCATTRRRRTMAERRQAQPQPAKLPDLSLDAGAGNGANAQFVTGRCLSSKDCGAQQSDLSKVCCASVVDSATGETVGVCSGSAVGNAAPKLGCGFGDGLANSAGSGMAAAAVANPAAAAAGQGQGEEEGCPTTTTPSSGSASGGNTSSASPAAAAPVTQAQPAKLPDPGLDAGKGNQANKQFITGACINAKDCGASQSDLANVCCASVMSASGEVVGVCSGSAVGNAAPKMGCGFGDGKANAAV